MDLQKVIDEMTQRYSMIIRYHKEEANKHLESIKNYEKALELLILDKEALKTISRVFNEEEPGVVGESNKRLTQKQTKRRSKSKSSERTLEEIVKSYITESETLLSAEALRTKYNDVKKGNISITNFSPRIAELKKSRKIGKYINIGADIKNKFLYGLPEWFSNIDAGILKPEFIEKIKAGKQIQLY